MSSPHHTMAVQLPNYSLDPFPLFFMAAPSFGHWEPTTYMKFNWLVLIIIMFIGMMDFFPEAELC